MNWRESEEIEVRGFVNVKKEMFLNFILFFWGGLFKKIFSCAGGTFERPCIVNLVVVEEVEELGGVVWITCNVNLSS